MKPCFSIVGCGRVGTTLAKCLTDAGYRSCGLASRSGASAKAAAKASGCALHSVNPIAATREADVVFITTPDDAIERVCEEIAEKGGFKKGALVYHCSGSLPSTLLSSAKEAGALIGSMHPLQSFASTDTDSNPFKGIIVSVEGDRPAVDLALEMAWKLGATGLTIRTDAKAIYHAAAVVASNALVTIVDLAYQLIEVAGISSDDAYKVLGPLIEGTLKNIKSKGTVEALTGPVVRGDVSVIEKHVKEIEDKTPDLSELYRVLGKYTVEVARKKGTLSEESLDALLKALS